MCSVQFIPRNVRPCARLVKMRRVANDQAQRQPPEKPGRPQESLTNYLNRPPAQRGGGSLQRSGRTTLGSWLALGIEPTLF